MDQNDRDEPGRESARETARRQRALDEAILRRQEDLEAAENRALDREAERARWQRSSSRLHRLLKSQDLPSDPLDSEHNPYSRYTSPSVPPSSSHPIHARTRFASSDPLSSQTTHRHRNYGHATVHQYHYPDPAPSNGNRPSIDRRPSDSIRDRGREVIERERAKVAAERRQSDNADNTRSNEAQWESVFDEDDGRMGELEYEDISDFWAGDWTETG